MSTANEQIIHTEIEASKRWISSSPECRIWHRRLGHLNRNNVKILGLPYSNEKCNKCIEGKAGRLPFTRNNKTTRRIGELIYTTYVGQSCQKHWKDISSVPSREFFLENFSRNSIISYFSFLEEIRVFLDNLQCRKIIIHLICFQKLIFSYFKMCVNREYINQRLPTCLLRGKSRPTLPSVVTMARSRGRVKITNAISSSMNTIIVFCFATRAFNTARMIVILFAVTAICRRVELIDPLLIKAYTRLQSRYISRDFARCRLTMYVEYLQTMSVSLDCLYATVMFGT